MQNHLDKALGHRVRFDLGDGQGNTLAHADDLVTGELLYHVRQRGLEDRLLRAVADPLRPVQPVNAAAFGMGGSL